MTQPEKTLEPGKTVLQDMPILTLEPSGQTLTIQVLTRPPAPQGTTTGLTEACVDPPSDVVGQDSDDHLAEHEEDMPHEDQDNDPHVRLRLQAAAQRNAPADLTPEQVMDIQAPVLGSNPALSVAPEDQVSFDPSRALYDWREPTTETGPESPTEGAVGGADIHTADQEWTPPRMVTREAARAAEQATPLDPLLTGTKPKTPGMGRAALLAAAQQRVDLARPGSPDIRMRGELPTTGRLGGPGRGLTLLVRSSVTTPSSTVGRVREPCDNSTDYGRVVHDALRGLGAPAAEVAEDLINQALQIAKIGEARENFARNIQVRQLGGNVVTNVDLRQVYDEEMAHSWQARKLDALRQS